MAPISIGEIHVPGGTGQAAARCLTLTSPLQQEGGLELFFAMLAADAPKRVVDKLCERLSEELRAVFFQKGEPEARFEAALKQANKSILAFLYEHGLSLPGIKLRGAAAALSQGKLFVSSRGMLRGLLYIPQEGALASYALFEETPEKSVEPKFFTSLQVGTFPDGARLVIATSELFQSLDDAYVRDLLGQHDFAKASREVKAALRNAQKSVSILSLSSPLPDGATAPIKPLAAKKAAAPKAARAAAALITPDVGEMAARGLRAAFLFIGRGLSTLARALWRLIKGLVLLPMRLPRLIGVIADREQRDRLVAACKAAPDRCMSNVINRLNALPSQSRMQFFALVAFGAIFAHGLLFSIRHEVHAQTAKAYESQLAELQQLETDFDAGMIYDNESRSRDLLSRMDTVWDALPAATDAQKKTKADAKQGIDQAREKLRHVTLIDNPTAFASLNDASFSPSTMAWFGDKLYVFSGTSGRVHVLSSEGAAASDPTVASLPEGILAAASARTGFLLQGVSGKLVYWNPDTNEETAYDAAGIGNNPILFYEGRLYAAAQDGSVTRRSVATKNLGSPSDVLRAAPASPSGIATDGAVYLLDKDGSTQKYLKGAAVQDYSASPIDPAPTNASSLWASADSDRIVFIDKGGDHAYEVDRNTGRLLAQLTSPAFKNLVASAIDDKGHALSLLTSAGAIYQVPLK